MKARQFHNDYPVAEVPTGGDGEADGAVIGLDLDHQRAQHVQAEGLPRPGVLGVDRHRGGDVVVDPVIGALVVVVRAAAGDGVGAHVGDGAGVGGVPRAIAFRVGSALCSVAAGRPVSLWGSSAKVTRSFPGGPSPAASERKASWASSGRTVELTS